jgi:hypothetical protein
MGRDTGFTVETVRFPGRGSDYFGPCEVCGKSMSETAVFRRCNLYAGDGFLYLAATSPGLYAHMSCRLHDGLRIVSESTLKRIGNLVEYPLWALRSDLLAAGFSPSGADETMAELFASSGARRPDENSPSGPSDRALNPQTEAVDHDRGAL